tara:strand:- start:23448 stop:24065 length:618 start_codon:yes stop_codon:yes gene_type:complete
MKLKVCGMKFIDNIKSIADLKPDYMGFIFYDTSKRNFEGIMPDIPKNIKKTGVFVNEYIEIVVSLIEEYKLEAVQLHGDETVAYIQQLNKYLSSKIEIIKVVTIKDSINYILLKPFENEVDYFLFDTKGKARGGNGVKFDWSLLKDYPYSKPFFLSGGIGPKDIKFIKEIKKSGLPIYAIDINSKFEDTPGVKNIKEVLNFRNHL